MRPIENLFENYNSEDGGAAQKCETVIIDVDEPTSVDDELEAGGESGCEELTGELCMSMTAEEEDVYLPPSLHFNRNTMEVSIRPKNEKKSKNFTFGPTKLGVSEIVCIPNMEEMMDGGEDDYGDLYEPCPVKPPPLLSFSEQNQSVLNRNATGATTYPKILPKPATFSSNGTHHNNMATVAGQTVREDTERKVMKGLMLRSPRGNQPRTYTQEELFQALNAIKSGLSIYRASQRYKVPRKTLRNWMKRWHIKSVFPMPAQLQRAAEKKKEQRDQILASISLFQDAAIPSQIESHIS